MEKPGTLCVDLDVHKDSIDIATADAPRDAEVCPVGSVGHDMASLGEALRRLISRGHRLQVVQNAGSCGLVIWPHSAAQGLAVRGGGPVAIALDRSTSRHPA